LREELSRQLAVAQVRGLCWLRITWVAAVLVKKY
jgi:hypothetical protein